MFHRATISRADGGVKLEWVYAAFRFYPVEPDKELGWRLHLADAATNKLLALSGRAEPRDFVDAVRPTSRHRRRLLATWPIPS